VKPVSGKAQTVSSVYLPGVELWCDIRTGAAFAGGQSVTVNTPLDRIPVFQRGGSIIPKKERSRRSSALMVNDPYTLVVALDGSGAANGLLYIDDGRSFDYKKGHYCMRS